MKKIALVVIILASACIVFGNGLSESIYTGQSTNSVWAVKYSVDDFGYETEEKYITTIEPIQGNFTESSLGSKHYPVEVYLVVVKGIAVIEIYKNDELVKWENRKYTLRIKDSLGYIYSTEIAPNFNDRVDFLGNDFVRLIEGLSLAGNMKVAISKTLSHSYYFTVETTGFKDLYESTFGAL